MNKPLVEKEGWKRIPILHCTMPGIKLEIVEDNIGQKGLYNVTLDKLIVPLQPDVLDISSIPSCPTDPGMLVWIFKKKKPGDRTMLWFIMTSEIATKGSKDLLTVVADWPHLLIGQHLFFINDTIWWHTVVGKTIECAWRVISSNDIGHIMTEEFLPEKNTVIKCDQPNTVTFVHRLDRSTFVIKIRPYSLEIEPFYTRPTIS